MKMGEQGTPLIVNDVPVGFITHWGSDVNIFGEPEITYKVKGYPCNFTIAFGILNRVVSSADGVETVVYKGSDNELCKLAGHSDWSFKGD